MNITLTRALSLWVFACLPLAFVACSSTGGGEGGSSTYKWHESKGKVSIKDTITLNSTKDYGWRIVDGSGLSGNGDQSEGQEPPFIINKGGLKNVIAEAWPESVSIRGNNVTIDGMEQKDVGEDAVSTYKNHTVKGLTIRNSAFAKATDKILQLNEGSGDILIENCYFDVFKSAIRIKKGVKNVTIRNCRFIGGKRAIVLDPGVAKPKIENCSVFNGVVLLYQDG